MIINFAVRQITCGNMKEIFEQEDFFKEYFKVFGESKIFDENVIHNIDIKYVIDLSQTLIKIFEEKIKILQEFKLKNEIGLIIFIGNGNIDGHSIILEDSSYVFVDLSAIILRSNRSCDLETFMCHEIIHAIHYDFNKEFYPKNYTSISDKYLKMIIEEGLATYMSMSIFGLSKELGYWLGYLENSQVNEWILNCEKMKTYIGINLNQIISSNIFDENIYSKLFCIKSENLTSYRLGYYYGCQIVKNIVSNNNFRKVLCFRFCDIQKYINDYFNFNVIS